MENICDDPTFTGYTVRGGYAEYALARADFVFPLPKDLDDLHAAPLLCAGIIGFRALRVAECSRGSESGYSVLERPLILQLRCCIAGSATCTFLREARRIANWRSRWARNGWERKPISLPWNWIGL